MALNKGESSLASFSAETKFQEPSTFEEIANYLLKVSPSFLARLLLTKCETNEYGRITELKTENETTEKKENYDEAMMSLIKNAYDNLSQPYEIIIKILKFPSSLIREPAKVIYHPSKTYEKIKAHLVHLEDNGDFDELGTYSGNLVKFYQKEGDIDIVAAITMRQAQCCMYKNDLNGAMRFAKKALNLAENTSFPPLFQAQAFLAMSASSRNKNKLGDTKKYLDLAQQCFESGYCIEDFAHFYEVYGSYLDKFLGTFAKPDEQVKELAITNFSKMNEIASQDPRSRVSEKNLVYAMIRRARILLDSNSSLGRKQRMVAENSIHLATKCLGGIRSDLLESLPRGSKIQFQLVKSDLLYRQGKLGDAIELLRESFEEAKLFGFRTEEPKITQRIQEIERLIDESIDVDIVVGQNVVETDGSSASLKDTDIYTSQSESDVFTLEYF